MPPDVYQPDRLQKVLASLEAEALETEKQLSKIKSANKDATTVEDDNEGSANQALNNSACELEVPFGPYLFVAHGSCFQIVWTRIAYFGLLHLIYLTALYQSLAHGTIITVKTWLFAWVLFVWSGLGVTAGAHRLWSHKAYQARWPLRVFLMIGHCLAGQNTLLNWCKDHRVHHKYSESDSDPHNSKRGFFFAHIGWLLRSPHPDFKAARAAVYGQDLLQDPVVRVQHQRYKELCLVIALIVPSFVPVYFWGESLTMAFLVAVIVRYVTCLHNTWFVNSAAHMFGDRPYSPRMEPRQNSWVSFGAFGEGYHNYHHTFPFDYATAELGRGSLNFTKNFIDVMYRFGLAFDLKQANLRK